MVTRAECGFSREAGPWSSMSSSFVASPLQTSLGLNMACRSLSGAAFKSLGGVAFKTDTVEIGHAAGFLSPGRHEERLCLRNDRKLAVVVSPRWMLLSTRACGGNLYSGSGRQDAWQSRNITDGNYNSPTSTVCRATTSAQGVSASKVLPIVHNSFHPDFFLLSRRLQISAS